MSRRGLTTRDVGGKLGLDHSSVARWLGGATPRGATLKKLADYLGLSVDVLKDDGKELPPESAEYSQPLAADLVHEQAQWKPISDVIKDPEEEINELRRILAAAQTRLDRLTLSVRSRKKGTS